MSTVLATRAVPVGLPGLVVGQRGPGPLPRSLLAPGVLLLAGVRPGQLVDRVAHDAQWGPLPRPGLPALIDAAAREHLVGAGGAAFPTDRKLASLQGRRVALVVVNGAEGEAASGKDGVLLGHVPHLVLDGAVLAAQALGAPRVVVRISADRPDLAAQLPAVLASRDDPVRVELSIGPSAFVAGEATAVIRALAGGPALPAELGLPPALPTRGLRRGGQVLLGNVETFARLAVAARGLPARSALASASGAVAGPGVVELPASRTLADLAAAAGGVVGEPTLLVAGGWHGRWIRWDGVAAAARLTHDDVALVGGRWGAGAFVWLPGDLDPVESLRVIAAELAAGSAGQCGPCWRGLPEVAVTLGHVAEGRVPRVAFEALVADVEGRGLCAHPTAAVAALRSALDAIGAVA
ncbi:MAG TPA: NADH-ubiquinone oxidoreductase-F iron-sulfur binding region domain-containing protein [Candidatus Nanopelagicales bacterium]